MAALLEAFRRVKREKQLIGFLALLNLLLSFAAARPFSAALEPVVDDRPAASALVRGDDGLWGELLEDHPELVTAATASANATSVVWALVSWMLAGGILAVVALGAGGGVGEVLRASVPHAWRMLWIGLLECALRLVPVFVAFVAAVTLQPLMKGHGFAQLALGASLVLATFALVWSMVTVMVDYARALAVATPSLGVVRTVGRAFRLAWRRRSSTLWLSGFLLVAWGTITLVQLALLHALPAEPAWSDALGWLVRVCAALGRAAVTVTTLVAAGRIALVTVAESPAEAGPFRAEAAPLG